jgi:hypothetical protein
MYVAEACILSTGEGKKSNIQVTCDVEMYLDLKEKKAYLKVCISKSQTFQPRASVNEYDLVRQSLLK